MYTMYKLLLEKMPFSTNTKRLEQLSDAKDRFNDILTYLYNLRIKFLKEKKAIKKPEKGAPLCLIYFINNALDNSDLTYKSNELVGAFHENKNFKKVLTEFNQLVDSYEKMLDSILAIIIFYGRKEIDLPTLKEVGDIYKDDLYKKAHGYPLAKANRDITQKRLKIADNRVTELRTKLKSLYENTVIKSENVITKEEDKEKKEAIERVITAVTTTIPKTDLELNWDLIKKYKEQLIEIERTMDVIPSTLDKKDEKLIGQYKEKLEHKKEEIKKFKIKFIKQKLTADPDFKQKNIEIIDSIQNLFDKESNQVFCLLFDFLIAIQDQRFCDDDFDKAKIQCTHSYMTYSEITKLEIISILNKLGQYLLMTELTNEEKKLFVSLKEEHRKSFVNLKDIIAQMEEKEQQEEKESRKEKEKITETVSEDIILPNTVEAEKQKESKSEKEEEKVQVQTRNRSNDLPGDQFWDPSSLNVKSFSGYVNLHGENVFGPSQTTTHEEKEPTNPQYFPVANTYEGLQPTKAPEYIDPPILKKPEAFYVSFHDDEKKPEDVSNPSLTALDEEKKPTNPEHSITSQSSESAQPTTPGNIGFTPEFLKQKSFTQNPSQTKETTSSKMKAEVTENKDDKMVKSLKTSQVAAKIALFSQKNATLPPILQKDTSAKKPDEQQLQGPRFQRFVKPSTPPSVTPSEGQNIHGIKKTNT